jgi:hypothetical protein
MGNEPDRNFSEVPDGCQSRLIMNWLVSLGLEIRILLWGGKRLRVVLRHCCPLRCGLIVHDQGGRLSAVRAVPNDVQRMRGRFEALGRGQFFDHLGYGPLKCRCRGHVNDPAATRAQQMVMMLGQVLG